MSNDLTGKDAIIADNDSLIRGILRSILERGGFTVLQAVDGLEAVDYATRTRARLVLLDVKMPRLNGIAACSQIRRMPGYADVPIVILTAFDDEAARAAALQAGATGFFAKPFKSIDLLNGIAQLLGTSAAEGGKVHGTPGSAPFVWQRRHEPQPLYGEPTELSEGRRVLNICRR